MGLHSVANDRQQHWPRAQATAGIAARLAVADTVALVAGKAEHRQRLPLRMRSMFGEQDGWLSSLQGQLAVSRSVSLLLKAGCLASVEYNLDRPRESQLKLVKVQTGDVKAVFVSIVGQVELVSSW